MPHTTTWISGYFNPRSAELDALEDEILTKNGGHNSAKTYNKRKAPKHKH
jgi:hypothetical protein